MNYFHIFLYIYILLYTFIYFFYFFYFYYFCCSCCFSASLLSTTVTHVLSVYLLLPYFYQLLPAFSLSKIFQISFCFFLFLFIIFFLFLVLISICFLPFTTYTFQLQLFPSSTSSSDQPQIENHLVQRSRSPYLTPKLFTSPIALSVLAHESPLHLSASLKTVRPSLQGNPNPIPPLLLYQHICYHSNYPLYTSGNNSLIPRILHFITSPISS